MTSKKPLSTTNIRLQQKTNITTTTTTYCHHRQQQSSTMHASDANTNTTPSPTSSFCKSSVSTPRTVLLSHHHLSLFDFGCQVEHIPTRPPTYMHNIIPPPLQHSHPPFENQKLVQSLLIIAHHLQSTHLDISHTHPHTTIAHTISPILPNLRPEEIGDDPNRSLPFQSLFASTHHHNFNLTNDSPPTFYAHTCIRI